MTEQKRVVRTVVVSDVEYAAIKDKLQHGEQQFLYDKLGEPSEVVMNDAGELYEPSTDRIVHPWKGMQQALQVNVRSIFGKLMHLVNTQELTYQVTSDNFYVFFKSGKASLLFNPKTNVVTDVRGWDD